MSAAENEGKRLTRREFVKGSAAGGVAGLVVGAGGAVITSSRPWLPKKWDYEADVVVVGTGFAGQNAAIASHDAGAKVLVLEKAPEQYAGGNSGVSGGGMTVPQNVPDAIEYYRSLCFGTVPEDLCVVMAEAMAKVPEQLKKIGIETSTRRFASGAAPAAPARTPSSAPPRAPVVRTRSGLSLLPGSGNSRIYYIVPSDDADPRMGAGQLLYLALKKRSVSRGIKFLYETPAKRLIRDPETKAILGVVAEAQGNNVYVKAKRGVVLACGGYETNHEMEGYFNYPGLRIYQWGTPYNSGDGIKMASEAGAFLWHMFSIEWAGPSIKAPSEHYGVSVQASIGFGAARSFIYANKYGKRFMNELKNLVHNKESLELTYFNNERVEYPNNPFYLVFDETLKTKQPLSSSGGMGGRMTWNGVHGVYKWSADNNAEIEKGWIIKADTIKELAAKIQMDAAGLEETIAKYNEYCRRGKDAEFDRRKESLLPIQTPPYYATELALTCINTQGGPKHNGKAQTLDTEDKPIPRLYSAGELGSFFGFLYPGGSNIPEAIAFGRIAGENAAVEKPWS
jgi:succinate dehydrogenase/fumarate reductase flavoprotein subunit